MRWPRPPQASQGRLNENGPWSSARTPRPPQASQLVGRVPGRAPLPEQVEMQVYKRYSGQYETLKTTVPFSQIESQPITLKNR